MRNSKGRLGKWTRSDGSSLLETALVAPILLLLVAGAVDFGRACTVAIEVEDAAHAGALYGEQNPTDSAGMKEAALNEVPDLSGLTATAAYGCECSDGSSPVPSCTTIPVCTYNYVDYVSVTATVQLSPLVTYPGLPSSLNLSSTSRLRAGGD